MRVLFFGALRVAKRDNKGWKPAVCRCVDWTGSTALKCCLTVAWEPYGYASRRGGRNEGVGERNRCLKACLFHFYVQQSRRGPGVFVKMYLEDTS